MSMQLREIENKLKWDTFIKENEGHFLQSFDWGSFQVSLGRKVWYLGLEDNLGNIKEVMLLIKMPIKFGYSWLYAPRWKVYTDLNNSKEIFKKIKEIAKENKSILFKTDPYINKNDKIDLSMLGLGKIDDEKQPQNKLILDITKTKEQLTKEMHHKTRYNINLARKKGVKINWLKDSKDIKSFNDLMHKTKKRKGFISHSDQYYKNLMNNGGFELAYAIFEDRVIAANLIKIFGKIATYVHGATDYQYRNIMAPHLLQWKCILEAKKRGCSKYDFWGVQGKEKKKTSWEGFSRFKHGFAPELEVTEYVGMHGVVFKKWIYFLDNCKKRMTKVE